MLLLDKKVLIHSLVNSPELNGTVGKVQFWYSSKQRYGVVLEGGQVISLKPANLSDVDEQSRIEAVTKRIAAARQAIAERSGSGEAPPSRGSSTPPPPPRACAAP